MASKSACILLLVVAVAVPILTAAAPLGGFKPIKDPKAPEVVAIAKFAVEEYNKEKKTSLSFVSVVKGETQVVAGINYRLVISAIYAGAAVPREFNAFVFSDFKKKKLSLVSFQSVN